MSVLINIENYEVYYLDYLKGNLNEEQSHAFLAFLELHPELKLADEELTVLLPVKEGKLDRTTKNSLKIDLSAEILTEENVENFMIASVEQQLSGRQEKNLQHFIQQHPAYEAEFQWYKKSILAAEQVTYPFKSTLKKGGFIIPMYYKAVAIAASLILIVLLVKSYTTSPIEVSNTRQSAKNIRNGNEKHSPADHRTNGTNPVKNEKEETVLRAQNGSVSKVSPTTTNNPAKTEGLIIQMRKLAPVSASQTEASLVALTIESVPTEQKTQTPEDVTANSYLSVKEMNAPIYLISKEIKERFNQDVDFRSAKATRKRQGGYYLKIGNIEITRKKKPISDDLAAN